MNKTVGSFLVALGMLLTSEHAIAKWNSAWKERTNVVLDTSAAGVATKSSVSQIVLPVRLHTGNFEFAKAKADGSDLRFIAADRKSVV